MKVTGAVLAAAGMIVALNATASAQDVAKGEKVFNQCSACHALDHALVGPPLAGVVGRKAGSVADFSYSPLMKAAGDAGLVWTDAELVNYLKNPTQYLKDYLKSKGKEGTGSSKMIFMLSSEDQRKNVIAYLAKQK